MKRPIEQYTQLPESIHLPRGNRTGLASLWERSTVTQTEWIGATIYSYGEYPVIRLGHQAVGMVTVPVVNLGRIAEKSHRKIDEEFIREECVISQWDISRIPNEKDVCYSGAIVYLLPRNIIPGYTNLFLSVLSPENRVIPEEELLGIAHSHLSMGSLSHLPSLRDVRQFVFGPLPISFEQVISGENTSLLVKSKDTPHYQSHPESTDYLNRQELADNIELQEGQNFLEVLQKNCRRYKLGLYSGKLHSAQLCAYFP